MISVLFCYEMVAFTTAVPSQNALTLNLIQGINKKHLQVKNTACSNTVRRQ